VTDETEARPWWRVEPETQALRRLQTAMSESEVALGRRMRLGHSELAAMTHLSSSTRPVGPGWLSQRLGVTAAAATELVDRLERAGHLERRRDTVDRRRVHLIPSDSALTDVGSHLAPLLAAIDQSARSFTPAERDAIRRFLDSVVEAYADFAED
jgi:DNA-binding MarR family transcriptional regulator